MQFIIETVVRKYNKNNLKFHEKQLKKKRVQLVGHGNCRFTVICTWYFIKSYYFNSIFNLLRLIKLIRVIIVWATIQLLSIVIGKRVGERDARYERTRMTLRMEETFTLRVTLRIEEASTERVIFGSKNTICGISCSNTYLWSTHFEC